MARHVGLHDSQSWLACLAWLAVMARMTRMARWLAHCPNSIKSSPVLKEPTRTSTVVRVNSNSVLHNVSQQQKPSQKYLIISQLKSKRSRDSISFLQNVQNGVSTMLILNNVSFAKTMLFKTSY